MASDENLRVIRNEAIPVGEVDGELVALDVDKGHCFGMDRIGSTIWGLAAQPITVGEIVDVLAASHAVERQQCLSDVSSFVEELLEEGLLLHS